MSEKQTKRQRAAARQAERVQRIVSSSHRRKLDWAAAHIKRFDDCLDKWTKASYRVTPVIDAHGLTTIYGLLTDPIPDELGLIAGDTIQCLRQSLDHIIFALSKKGAAMTAADERHPQFPITNGETISEGHRGLKFIKPEWRPIILDLTPTPDDRRHPLRIINELSNRDKHRAIPLVVPFQTAGITMRQPPETLSYGGGMMEVGVQVPLMSYRGGPAPIVEPRLDPTFDPSVGVGTLPVTHRLEWIRKHIADEVMPKLEPKL